MCDVEEVEEMEELEWEDSTYVGPAGAAPGALTAGAAQACREEEHRARGRGRIRGRCAEERVLSGVHAEARAAHDSGAARGAD